MRRQLSQRGASLVEVLVAMLVVSLGVLAMAGLLATASRYGKSSEYRAVATLLASDMADRIRANKAALADPVVGAVDVYDMTAGYDTWSDEPDEPTDCVDAANCTAPEIAAQDRAEWARAVFSGLPGGAGFVSVSEPLAAAGNMRNFTADIWIAWLDPDDNSAVAGPDNECPPGFQDLDPQPRCTFFRVGL